MDKIYYESINETVYRFVAKNGLNVSIIKKEGFSAKSAFFATKFGSFNTGDIINYKGKDIKIIGGLAHFLEHRVFDYKDGNINDIYYKLGADVNAYTSYDRTVYYFSTTENFDECLKLLLDFPTSFTMSKEAVEGEKEIIINELLMYQDDPNDKLYKSLMKSLYKEHPIRFDVGGEVEEVRATTRELLELVHSVFYNLKNMELVIVGDIDIDKTIEIINNKEFKSKDIKYVKKQINEVDDIIKEYEIIETDTNNKKVLMGYKLNTFDYEKDELKTKKFIALDLLTSILFSSSSDFYTKLIDKKYITSLALDMIEYEGVFTLLIETDILVDEKIVIKEIDNQLKNAIDVIDETKLDRIKKKEIANIVKSSDNIQTLAGNFMTYILDKMNFFEMIDLIKSITLEDLKQAYKEYYFDAKYSYALLKGKEDD